MSHYFENDSSLETKEKIIKVNINGNKFEFITDNGVFSKKGLDFGTRTLLESININEIKGNVLDFGCGYGPIGIYIKKTTEANVTMLDINKRSVMLAKKNALLNNTDVEVYESDGYLKTNKKFDYIISNPPIRIGKKKLYDILFKAKDYLNKKGKLLIVINKNQGAKSLLNDLSKEYIVELKTKNKGFYVICASKCWLIEFNLLKL
mgnify:CR=1 FL=1